MFHIYEQGDPSVGIETLDEFLDGQELIDFAQRCQRMIDDGSFSPPTTIKESILVIQSCGIEIVKARLCLKHREYEHPRFGCESCMFPEEKVRVNHHDETE
jgi:hypothetical protein